MTSNVGSPEPATTSEAIRQSFKPEFLNRIDDIVDLRPARPRADRRDRRPPGRAARHAGRASAASRSSSRTSARTLIGNLGYDPIYGARPLKRVIQKRLVDPLALRILEGEFAEGDTVVVEAAGDGDLVLRGGRRARAASRSADGQRHAVEQEPADAGGAVVRRARVELQRPAPAARIEREQPAQRRPPDRAARAWCPRRARRSGAPCRAGRRSARRPSASAARPASRRRSRRRRSAPCSVAGLPVARPEVGDRARRADRRGRARGAVDERDLVGLVVLRLAARRRRRHREGRADVARGVRCRDADDAARRPGAAPRRPA